MEFLMSQQFYLILFAVLVVVTSIVIFKMAGASWQGFALAIILSLVLTAIAFYKTNPAMGMTVIFYLVVALGAIPLLIFATKSWSGFAFAVVIVIAVLALYAYSTYPQYGLYVTLALVAIIALAISLSFSAYKYKVKVQSQMLLGSSGRKNRGPALPARTDVFAYLEDLSAKYPNTRKRAQYLLSRPEELNMVYESLDEDTLREVERLER